MRGLQLLGTPMIPRTPPQLMRTPGSKDRKDTLSRKDRDRVGGIQRYASFNPKKWGVQLLGTPPPQGRPTSQETYQTTAWEIK